MDAIGTSNSNSPLREEAWAADYLGTTQNHVRRLRVRGEIAHIRLGRFVRYSVADLDDFIAAQRHPAS